MKSQSVGFDVFDDRAHKFVEVASVLSRGSGTSDVAPK